jgi:putative cell wall-binding protein
MSKVLGVILTVGVILGVGGYFLVKESYAATPADPLFAVQEVADNVQRAFTFDDVAKTELEQDILVRRQEQVEKMSEREDISEEKMEEGLELMVQQREIVRERLQTVEQTMEQTEANEKTREVIQDVQKRYDENLDKQLETIDKVQEKYSGIGQSVEEDTVKEATERGRNVQEEIIEEVEEVGEGEGNAPDDLEVPEVQD